MRNRVKSITKRALAYGGMELKRLPRASQSPVLWSVEAGPWAPGYREAKYEFIRRSLNDFDLLKDFKVGRLPKNYGVAIDERCVEYPWTFSHIHSDRSTQVLDAGSALNHEAVVDLEFFQKNRVHILTLAPEQKCFWFKGISYLYADLRSIPIRDDFYDTITCISTLEHVGYDNFAQTGDEAQRTHSPTDYLVAVRELRRVLKRHGALYLTVPFGKNADFKTFRQFDENLLESAISEFGPANVTRNFFKYTDEGWRWAEAVECSSCEYVSWVATLWDGGPWPNPLPIEHDRAAAARGIACVRLIKE